MSMIRRMDFIVHPLYVFDFTFPNGVHSSTLVNRIVNFLEMHGGDPERLFIYVPSEPISRLSTELEMSLEEQRSRIESTMEKHTMQWMDGRYIDWTHAFGNNGHGEVTEFLKRNGSMLDLYHNNFKLVGHGIFGEGCVSTTLRDAARGLFTAYEQVFGFSLNIGNTGWRRYPIEMVETEGENPYNLRVDCSEIKNGQVVVHDIGCEHGLMKTGIYGLFEAFSLEQASVYAKNELGYPDFDRSLTNCSFCRA